LGIPALIFLYFISGEITWLWLIPIWLGIIPIISWARKQIHQLFIAHPHNRILKVGTVILLYLPQNAAHLGRIWIWTALSWSSKLVAFTTIVMHFSGLGPAQAVLGTLGAELSSVLPINGIAGAGTYELAMSAVLVPIGLDITTILKAAVNLHLYLLGSSLLLGLCGLCLIQNRNVNLFIPTSVNEGEI
jgi:uncharacterized membrane protein YbhN (UPF0104 family)